MSSEYSEDTLVQQTTAEYMEQQLGWREKLVELNPDLPDEAYDDAVRQITATVASQAIVATNREKHDLVRNGVQVTFRNDKGERVRERLRVFDYAEPANNHFLCVRELWVHGDLYRKRADIVGFVNGLPLLFVELKNIHRNLKTAFEKNFSDYKDTIPHLFHHNAIVMFGNGEQAKIGSITSKWEAKLHGHCGELHPI
jgi:type I restriction enzyme R subunit